MDKMLHEQVKRCRITGIQRYISLVNKKLRDTKKRKHDEIPIYQKNFKQRFPIGKNAS